MFFGSPVSISLRERRQLSIEFNETNMSMTRVAVPKKMSVTVHWGENKMQNGAVDARDKNNLLDK